MLPKHLILCCPFLLLPSFFPSIRVFFNELALCIIWPKYWSFSFSISPSNEYSGMISKATARTGHGMTDSFQTGKGVHQGCILSPSLFNLYAEYIKWNARLDEAEAGSKIARRNINNLRYSDDTTLMAESEGLKSLLKKVKGESEKVGLILNIQKTKIMHLVPSLLGKKMEKQ